MEFFNTISNVPGEAWALLVEIIAGAIIASPVAVGLKKWWSIKGKKHQEKIMVFLVIALSMVMSGVMYLRGTPDYGPWVIAVEGWLVFGATQPVYFLFVKPLTERLRVWWISQLAQAAQANEAKTAVEPETGVVGSNQIQNGAPRDFSN